LPARTILAASLLLLVASVAAAQDDPMTFQELIDEQEATEVRTQSPPPRAPA